MRSRRLAILLALAAALTVVGGSSDAGAQGDAPTFAVHAGGDADFPELRLSFDFSAAENPARVTIYVPASFELFPVRPEGRPVGTAVVYAGDSSYGAAASSLLAGRIVAGRLDALAEAKAQPCSRGEHLALWRVELSLLGQPLELPIYVSAAGPGAPPEAVLKLDLCAPALPASDPSRWTALPILALNLSLDGLEGPRSPGLHVWRSVVTPLAPDQRTALPNRAYELRATVPAPHLLTLAGRYTAKDRRAVVTGRLTAAGAPRGGVPVYFIALIRRVTADGVRFSDRLAGVTRTTARGDYRFRTRIGQTTGFVAVVPEVAGRCGDSSAPRGCLSSTIAGIESEPITVSVPRQRRR